MAKYLVKKNFKGVKEKRRFIADQEVKMTVKRADEINEKLGEEYLERIDKKEEAE